MSDRELDELRQRRLQEMQAQAEQQLAQEQERVTIEAQVQGALRQLMSAEAKERLAQVRVAEAEMEAKVEDGLEMPDSWRALFASDDVRYLD